MTREKAIERVSRWLDKGKQHEDNQLGYIEGWFTKEDEQAFLMAINVLQTEPCEDAIHREREQAYMQGYEDASKNFRREYSDDCISRQAVHDMLENLPITVEDKWFNWLQKACIRLAGLPSVQPPQNVISRNKEGDR